MKKLFIIGVLLLISVLSYFNLKPLLHSPPLFYPLSENPPAPLPPNPPISIIYGFLPYWNLTKIEVSSLKHLTDLAYFGVTVNETGHLIHNDLGYRRFIANYELLSTLTQTHGLNLHLVIKTANDQELFNFLHNPQAQATLNHELAALQADYPVAGYNLDFEPTTATNAATIAHFTDFVNQFKIENLKYKISVDIYPSAASSPKLWDLSALKPFVDHFIVMAYDYTPLASPVTGPVAPVYPPPNQKHALLINLKQIWNFVPPSQVLIGLPLYGYEWQTPSTELFAPTIKGTGQLATLSRIHTLIEEQKLIPETDPQTQSSRIIQPLDRTYSQIYFEDSVTIRAKVILAQNAGYAGLALWAIGYEGNFDFWSSILPL